MPSRPCAQFPRLLLDLARGPTQKPGYLFNGHSSFNRGPQEEQISPDMALRTVSGEAIEYLYTQSMRTAELWFLPIREAFVLVRKSQHLLPGRLVAHFLPDGAHLLSPGTPILLMVFGLHTPA